MISKEEIDLLVYALKMFATEKNWFYETTYGKYGEINSWVWDCSYIHDPCEYAKEVLERMGLIE